jgi:RNA polymerase sigma-70 factor, ECF subfamily
MPGAARTVGGVGTQPDDEHAEVARFERLAGELIEPLRRYLARRTDAETAQDVLADALLVCWRRLRDVPEGDQALPWAYAVARRCLSNAERSDRRQRRLAGKVAALDPPVAAIPDAGTSAVPYAGPEIELHEALARLRPGEAELLRLWAWEQLKPAEIAAVLDLTPNAVSIRLHRAKAALRAELEAGARKNPVESGHEPAEGRQ